MLNLDTHIAVALLDGSLDSKETAAVLSQPLAVSAILLWEIAKLVQLRRLVFDVDGIEFRDFLQAVT